MTTRNAMHISGITLRHYVRLLLKFPALEEFKLPIDFSTSTLSTHEKRKVVFMVLVSLIFFTLG